MNRAAWILMTLTLASGGCETPVRHADGVAETGRDPPRAAALVANPGGEDFPPAGWAVRAAFTIGVDTGPAHYEFDRITALDVDDDGNTYILDAGYRRVRQFDASGRFLREMGGDGGGPGEFARGPMGGSPAMRGMTLVGDSLVVVLDPWAWRLVSFDLEGRSRGSVDLKPVLPTPTMAARSSARLAWPGREWLVIHQCEGYGGGQSTPATGRCALIRVSIRGDHADTVLSYVQDDVVFVRLNDRMGEFFPKPFPRRWQWAVSPNGWIAFGNGETYTVTVQDPLGRRVSVMTRGIPPRPVSRADVAEFRRRFPFGSGLDDLSASVRRLAEESLEDLTFPETWPAFDALLFDDTGGLWVRRTPESGVELAEWDVFDAQLRYAGTVSLSSRERLLATTADRAFSLVHDELGVAFVNVYALR